LNLAFSGSFAGQKTIFMLATSAGGANTGWLTRGTWVVPAALFRDDFNGSALDASDWFLPAGAGTFLGRTQLRPPSESLGVANGVVRLRLDTYNPTALVPGDSFWGSEIVSNAIFGRGAGLTFSARARLAGPVPGGLVASVFSYMTQSGVRDEIDVELLSNDLAAPRLLTNVFDDNDFSHPGHPAFATIPGFSLTDFNLYQVDWLPDRVRWRVNGIVIREDLVNVPDDPMSIRLNLWAPAATFAAAYNASLQPVDNAAANQTSYYEVDFIEVREAP
jgi:beta-glucanase (GH16 family)